MYVWRMTPHCSETSLHNNVINICFSVKFTFRCCLDVLKYNLFNVVNRFKNISVVAPVLLLLLLTVAFNANRWLMVLMTTSSCDSWILKQNVHLLLLLHSSPRLHSSDQSSVSIVHVHLRRQRQIRDVFISPIRSSIVTTRLVQSTVFLSLIFTLHFPPLPLPSLLPPPLPSPFSPPNKPVAHVSGILVSVSLPHTWNTIPVFVFFAIPLPTNPKPTRQNPPLPETYLCWTKHHCSIWPKWYDWELPNMESVQILDLSKI